MTKIRIGWVPPALWFLGSLAILSGVFRTYVTTDALTTGVMPADPADAHYVHNALLTFLHVVPGMIFLLLGPLQFIADIRKRWPRFHHWSGRVFILSGVAFAVTALVINFSFPPFGGPLKSLAVIIFSVLEILTLAIALYAVLQRDFVSHRAWKMRAFAIGLAISTMRLFFIPAYLLFGVPGNLTIALGMWIGFLVNILVVEWILRRDRLKRAPTISPALELNRPESSL
jgi:uncharacterized membrane protein